MWGFFQLPEASFLQVCEGDAESTATSALQSTASQVEDSEGLQESVGSA
ncbi:hypothetical protein BH10PLA2_BH10PLA2_38830 [soil metagenome]